MRPITPRAAAVGRSTSAVVGPPSQTSAETAALPASITAITHPCDDGGRSNGAEARVGSNPLTYQRSPRDRWVAPAVPGSFD